MVELQGIIQPSCSQNLVSPLSKTYRAAPLVLVQLKAGIA